MREMFDAEGFQVSRLCNKLPREVSYLSAASMLVPGSLGLSATSMLVPDDKTIPGASLSLKVMICVRMIPINQPSVSQRKGRGADGVNYRCRIV